jgi:hypothetical protein
MSQQNNEKMRIAKTIVKQMGGAGLPLRLIRDLQQ